MKIEREGYSGSATYGIHNSFMLAFSPLPFS